MTEPHAGGDPEGIVYHPGEIAEHASAVGLAKEIGDWLERTYPGYGWGITVDPRGGVIHLRALKLHGEWGYVLKLADVQSDPHRREVRRAAGEILERFRQPLGPYSYEAWRRAPRDVSGMLRPDISDKEARTRRRARDDAFTQAVKRGCMSVRREGDLLVVEGYRTPNEDGTRT